jgi:hypothetical protein
LRYLFFIILKSNQRGLEAVGLKSNQQGLQPVVALRRRVVIILPITQGDRQSAHYGIYLILFIDRSNRGAKAVFAGRV